MKADVKITPPKPETLDAIRDGDEALFRKVLARTWLEQQGDTSLPHAVEGSRVRHSWAGKCGRALRYEIDGVPASNPPDVAAHWVFRLGHLVHDEIQAALQAAFPGLEIEVGLPNPAIDGSFTLDGWLAWDDEEVNVIEIKSIGGFGFKMMNGARAEDGPRHSALLQLALNANRTPHCTGGWMIYAAMENTSINEAERKGLSVLDRFLWVKWYPVEKLRPLAELEEKRMLQVLAQADAGEVTPRFIPDGNMPADAVIVDPSKMRWEVRDKNGNVKDTGAHPFACLYCNHLAKCIEDGE